MSIEEAARRHWRATWILTLVLLAIWAVVGLGCGVLFADKLNAYSLGGYPLGFWFAQQGSIMTFVVLILVYAVVMGRLGSTYHKRVEAAKASATAVESGGAA